MDFDMPPHDWLRLTFNIVNYLLQTIEHGIKWAITGFGSVCNFDEKDYLSTYLLIIGTQKKYIKRILHNKIWALSFIQSKGFGI